MGWKEVEDAQKDAQSAEQAKQQHEELEKAAQAALNHRSAGPLVSFMTKQVQMISFKPGRSAEEVAYVEGYRAAMQHLLKLGGKL